MTIRHMRVACRIPKATNTHSQYVILIAFPQQQQQRLSGCTNAPQHYVTVQCTVCPVSVTVICNTDCVQMQFLNFTAGGTNSYHYALKCWITERTNSVDSQTWRYPMIMNWLFHQQQARKQQTRQAVLLATASVTIPALLTSQFTSAMLEMFEIFTWRRRAYVRSVVTQLVACNVRLELHETLIGTHIVVRQR